MPEEDRKPRLIPTVTTYTYIHSTGTINDVTILEECKALWGSPDRVVDMNLMAHGHILYYLDLMQYT